MHKGVFLFENIDTNKIYVCIFKHSFLKWTVGEEITRLQQTKKATSHKITHVSILVKRSSLLCVDVLQYFMCVLCVHCVYIV